MSTKYDPKFIIMLVFSMKCPWYISKCHNNSELFSDVIILIGETQSTGLIVANRDSNIGNLVIQMYEEKCVLCICSTYVWASFRTALYSVVIVI